MSKHYKIVELFSGIGSQAKALKNLNVDIDVQATCEWDIHAFIAYDAIHNDTSILEEAKEKNKEDLFESLATLHAYSEEVLRRIYTAIKRTSNLVDISKVSGNDMPDKTDLLTYSFPCQDLSNVGAFHHYNKGIDKNSGSRSSLLWEVGRILTEMKLANKRLPRYLVMENVPTLLSERHRDNFFTWINELRELGYISGYYQLNAKDFGIPQNRPRLLMLSVYVGDNDHKIKIVNNYFASTDEEKIVSDYRNSDFFHDLTVRDLLRITNDKGSALWNEAVECTPNDTPSRRKIWEENPVIYNQDGTYTEESFIRTITTKQDRNPNSGNIYFDSGLENRGKFRYLTPRECMLFMGFTDEDYEKLISANPEQRIHSKLFPRDKIIRMAGNSIPVKLLEGFFFQLINLDKKLSEK